MIENDSELKQKLIDLFTPPEDEELRYSDGYSFIDPKTVAQYLLDCLDNLYWAIKHQDGSDD